MKIVGILIAVLGMVQTPAFAACKQEAQLISTVQSTQFVEGTGCVVTLGSITDYKGGGEEGAVGEALGICPLNLITLSNKGLLVREWNSPALCATKIGEDISGYATLAIGETQPILE
jgi:hypothetical protein